MLVFFVIGAIGFSGASYMWSKAFKQKQVKGYFALSLLFAVLGGFCLAMAASTLFLAGGVD